MKMPTYFLSHGGGPWPWIDGDYGEAYTLLKQSLERLPTELPEKPKAVLMISAHWEGESFEVMANPRPSMFYDYGGFPKHTYQIKYPAPGSPEFAAKTKALLEKAGLPTVLDSERGFDHGNFVPMAVAFPAADIPLVQLSIRSDYNLEAHLQAGRALAPLREEGVLIIGSGLTYHNLRMFSALAAKPSHEFDRWLGDVVLGNPAERSEKLKAWENAPSARIAHPREDHLIPLLVAVGAAETEKGAMSYHEDDFLGGLAVSSYRFG